jgi:hypothetical protein
MTAKPKATRRGWTPTMEQRADLNGRQVKCLIASGTSGCGAISTGFLQSYDVALPRVVLTSARHAWTRKLGWQHRNQASPSILP